MFTIRRLECNHIGWELQHKSLTIFLGRRSVSLSSPHIGYARVTAHLTRNQEVLVIRGHKSKLYNMWFSRKFISEQVTVKGPVTLDIEVAGSNEVRSITVMTTDSRFKRFWWTEVHRDIKLNFYTPIGDRMAVTLRTRNLDTSVDDIIDEWSKIKFSDLKPIYHV